MTIKMPPEIKSKNSNLALETDWIQSLFSPNDFSKFAQTRMSAKKVYIECWTLLHIDKKVQNGRSSIIRLFKCWKYMIIFFDRLESVLDSIIPVASRTRHQQLNLNTSIFRSHQHRCRRIGKLSAFNNRFLKSVDFEGEHWWEDWHGKLICILSEF